MKEFEKWDNEFRNQNLNAFNVKKLISSAIKILL